MINYNALAPDKKLSTIFSTVSNRGRIDFNSTDDEIIDIINNEVEGAIDRSFNILRTRIDRFGTSQPNIQRLQGTGRIQIELPGVDNPERVRKLLQGVAKLEFWEVAELNEPEVFQTIQLVDQYVVKEGIFKSESSETQEASSETLADIEDLLDGDDSIEITEDNDLENDDLEVSDSIPSSTSPLFSKLRSEFGGLFYNLEDTIQINSILNNSNVRQLIPSNLKFLWSVKPSKNTSDPSDEVLQLFAIKSSRGGNAPLT